jgi:RHS repeat-associated protein
VTATQSRDAFGNVFAAGSSGTSNGSPFGFAGDYAYQSDSESGLMRLGYRMYDASVGRFLSRDPIQDGYNWYAYCNNDPTNNLDPLGLQTTGGSGGGTPPTGGTQPPKEEKPKKEEPKAGGKVKIEKGKPTVEIKVEVVTVVIEEKNGKPKVKSTEIDISKPIKKVVSWIERQLGLKKKDH